MAKAKVGDLVRIVNAGEYAEYKNGEIGEVTQSNHAECYLVVAFSNGEVYGVAHEDYEILPQSPPKDYAEPVTQADAVNSPPHYTQGKHEVIDIIEFVTQGYDDSFVGYCVGNTVKYVARAPFKHGSPAEDLRKAAWYLTKAADYVDGKVAE